MILHNNIDRSWLITWSSGLLVILAFIGFLIFSGGVEPVAAQEATEDTQETEQPLKFVSEKIEEANATADERLRVLLAYKELGVIPTSPKEFQIDDKAKEDITQRETFKKVYIHEGGSREAVFSQTPLHYQSTANPLVYRDVPGDIDTDNLDLETVYEDRSYRSEFSKTYVVPLPQDAPPGVLEQQMVTVSGDKFHFAGTDGSWIDMPVPGDPTIFDLDKDAKEILTDRTMNTKTFALPRPDGTPRQTFATVTGTQMHYQPAPEENPGVWSEINLEFEEDLNRDGVKEALSSPIHVYSSPIGITTESSFNGKGITWLFEGSASHAWEDQTVMVRDGQAWFYKNVLGGVKLTSQVHEPKGPQTYSFPYRVLDGTLDLVINENGDAVSDEFIVWHPIIVSQKGEVYKGSDWRVVEIDGVKNLQFDFDDGQFGAEDYPYIIDPTTTHIYPICTGFGRWASNTSPGCQPQNQAEFMTENHLDTTTMQSAYATNAAMYNNEHLIVGDNHSANHWSRGLIRFHGLEAIPLNARVIKAQMRIYLEEQGVNGQCPCEAKVVAYRVRKAWIEWEAEWNHACNTGCGASSGTLNWGGAGASARGEDIEHWPSGYIGGGYHVNNPAPAGYKYYCRCWRVFEGPSIDVDVQTWITNGDMNQGWLLQCSECEGGSSPGASGYRQGSDTFYFNFLTEDSTQWRLHPHLVIEWTTEGEWLQPCVTMPCADPAVNTFNGDSMDDTRIYADYVSAPYLATKGHEPGLNLGGSWHGGMDLNRLFLRWNVSHIPPDAIIHQASVGLWEYSVGNYNYPSCADGTPGYGYDCRDARVHLFAMKKPWDELTLNPNYYAGTNLWDGDGLNTGATYGWNSTSQTLAFPCAVPSKNTAFVAGASFQIFEGDCAVTPSGGAIIPGQMGGWGGIAGTYPGLGHYSNPVGGHGPTGNHQNAGGAAHYRYDNTMNGGGCEWSSGTVTNAPYEYPGNQGAGTSTTTGAICPKHDFQWFTGRGLAEDVQSWVSGTQENYGWMVLSEGESRQQSMQAAFRSSQWSVHPDCLTAIHAAMNTTFTQAECEGQQPVLVIDWSRPEGESFNIIQGVNYTATNGVGTASSSDPTTAEAGCTVGDYSVSTLDISHCYVRFDLSSIPSEAVVWDASLQMKEAGSACQPGRGNLSQATANTYKAGSPGTYQDWGGACWADVVLHRVFKDWNPDQVTWNNANNSETWTSTYGGLYRGGDIAASPSASAKMKVHSYTPADFFNCVGSRNFGFGQSSWKSDCMQAATDNVNVVSLQSTGAPPIIDQQSWKTWTWSGPGMIGDIQNWVAGTSTNYGWMLKCDMAGAFGDEGGYSYAGGYYTVARDYRPHGCEAAGREQGTYGAQSQIWVQFLDHTLYDTHGTANGVAAGVPRLNINWSIPTTTIKAGYQTAPSATRGTVKDTMICSHSPGSEYHTSTELVVGHWGTAVSGMHCKSLVRFEFEDTIPYGAKIEAAQLWLFEKTSRSGISANQYTPYFNNTEVWANRINKNAGNQYDVNLTWNNWKYANGWEYAGAEGTRDINHEPSGVAMASDMMSGYTTGSLNYNCQGYETGSDADFKGHGCWYVFTGDGLAKDIEDWVRNPRQNNGWLIQLMSGTNSTSSPHQQTDFGVKFYSQEDTWALANDKTPRLKIKWTGKDLIPSSDAIVRRENTSGSAPSNADSSITNNISNPVFYSGTTGGTYYHDNYFMQFDTSAIPDWAIVSEAKLILRHGQSSSSGWPSHSNRITVDWFNPGASIGYEDHSEIHGPANSATTTAIAPWDLYYWPSAYDTSAWFTLQNPNMINRTGTTTLRAAVTDSGGNAQTSAYAHIGIWGKGNADEKLRPKLVTSWSQGHAVGIAAGGDDANIQCGSSSWAGLAGTCPVQGAFTNRAQSEAKSARAGSGNYSYENTLFRWDTSFIPDDAIVTEANISFRMADRGVNTEYHYGKTAFNYRSGRFVGAGVGNFQVSEGHHYLVADYFDWSSGGLTASDGIRDIPEGSTMAVPPSHDTNLLQMKRASFGSYTLGLINLHNINKTGYTEVRFGIKGDEAYQEEGPCCDGSFNGVSFSNYEYSPLDPGSSGPDGPASIKMENFNYTFSEGPILRLSYDYLIPDTNLELGDVEKFGTSYPPTTDSSIDKMSGVLMPEQSYHIDPFRNSSQSTKSYIFRESLLRFDTSGLPNGATINGAKLSFYVYDKQDDSTRNLVGQWYDHGGTIDIGDYTTTIPASNHATFAGSKSIASFNELDYDEITLSNNAAANISTTGNTGIRLFIDGAAPGSDERNFIKISANLTKHTSGWYDRQYNNLAESPQSWDQSSRGDNGQYGARLYVLYNDADLTGISPSQANNVPPLNPYAITFTGTFFDTGDTFEFYRSASSTTVSCTNYGYGSIPTTVTADCDFTGVPITTSGTEYDARSISASSGNVDVLATVMTVISGPVISGISPVLQATSTFNLTISGASMPVHPFSGDPDRDARLIRSGQSDIICSSVSGGSPSPVIVSCPASAADIIGPYDVKVTDENALSDTLSAALQFFTPWSSTVNGGDFSPGGSDYGVFAHNGIPYFTVQAFDEVEKDWGSSSSPPAVLPSNAGLDAAFNLTKTRIVVGTDTAVTPLLAYQFSPSTGVISGTSSPTVPGTSAVTSVDFGAADNVIGATTDAGDYFYILNIDASAVIGSFWTSTLANTSTKPTGTCNDIDVRVEFIAVGCTTAPYLFVYNFNNGVPAIGSKVSDPSNPPTASVTGVEFSPDMNKIAITWDTYLSVYEFDDSTGTIGTLESVTLASAATGLDWQNEDTTGVTSIAASSTLTPFIHAWPYNTSLSTGAFGTKLIDPSPLPSGAGTFVGIHTNDDAIVLGQSVSPYITTYEYVGTSDDDFTIDRMVLNFDTSYLPDDATGNISSAKLYIPHAVLTSANTLPGTTHWDLYVQEGSIAAEPLSVTDFDFNKYDIATYPVIGSKNTAAMTGEAFTITLSATTFINTAGISQLILRHEHEVSSTATPLGATDQFIEIKYGGQETGNEFPTACASDNTWGTIQSNSAYNMCNAPSVPTLLLTYTSVTAGTPGAIVTNVTSTGNLPKSDGTYTVGVLAKGPVIVTKVEGNSTTVTGYDFNRVQVDNASEWKFLTSGDPQKPIAFVNHTRIYRNPAAYNPVDPIVDWTLTGVHSFPENYFIDMEYVWNPAGYVADNAVYEIAVPAISPLPTLSNNVGVASVAPLNAALPSYSQLAGISDNTPDLSTSSSSGVSGLPLESFWLYIESQTGMPAKVMVLMFALTMVIFGGVLAFRAFQSIAATFIVMMLMIAVFALSFGGIFPWWMLLTFAMTGGIFVFARRAYV